MVPVMASDPESVVVQFNEGINARDLDVLASLMTEDHVFIDSVGGRVDGRQRCLDAWRGFFGAYPDYRNEFTSMVTVSSGMVAVAGRSVCSDLKARVRSATRAMRVAEGLPDTRTAARRAWEGP